MKLIKAIVFLFLTFTLSVSAQDEITFEAKVSKKQLGVNERLRVDFEMNKDGDNFNPPSFDGFTVVGGPNQSVSQSWVNGKRTYKKTYSYFLSPKKRGKFSLKQATIEIGGQVYKTTPIMVTVSKAIDKPKDPNDPDFIASQNVHLVAIVPNNNPYLNEPITVEYRLYVDPSTGVSNWREIDNPRYNDFWSQNIKVKNQRIENGTYKGQDYRFVTLYKKVLYPQKTGKLEIEPLVLDVTVQVPTNRRDIFGSRLTQSVNKRVSAGNRSIQVKPLPEAGKPANFTGAVGDFDFTVTTSKNSLNASESFQANVKVSGNGNLKLFELPKLTLPSSLEVFEPEKNDNIRTSLSGMKGFKSENYTVVPQYKGKYPIPSVSFSYFDLKTKSYKTVSSEELVINVLEGPTNSTNSDSNIAASADSNKQQVVVTGEQFAFIKTKPNLVSKKASHFFKSKLFWSMLLMPLLAIPFAMVVRKKTAERQADVVGNKIRKADRLAKKYLGEAKKTLGQKEAFYNALERALHNYLKSKLNIETSDFSKEKISNLLNEKQVESTTVSEFVTILESCELARYTPTTNVTMKQDYDKAAQTIGQVDKQLRY